MASLAELAASVVTRYVTLHTYHLTRCLPSYKSRIWISKLISIYKLAHALDKNKSSLHTPQTIPYVPADATPTYKDCLQDPSAASICTVRPSAAGLRCCRSTLIGCAEQSPDPLVRPPPLDLFYYGGRPVTSFGSVRCTTRLGAAGVTHQRPRKSRGGRPAGALHPRAVGQLGKRHVAMTPPRRRRRCPALPCPSGRPGRRGVCDCVPARPGCSTPLPHVFLAPDLAHSRTYARKYTHAPNRVIRPVRESGRRPNYHRPAVRAWLFIVGSWLVTTMLASGSSAQWQQPSNSRAFRGLVAVVARGATCRHAGSHRSGGLAEVEWLALGAPTRPRWEI